MILNDAKKMLDSFLRDRLESVFGFSRVECLSYSRPANEELGLLTFSCRADARGCIAFTFSVGVRVKSLARWLDDVAETKPTVVVPIHLLREDTAFVEWKFTCVEDLEITWDSVAGDIRNLAIPFVTKYSKIPEIRRAMESPTPHDWLNFGRDARVTVLATIRFLEGDKYGAIGMLDEALVERAAAPPKRRFEIAYLRKRLMQG